MKYNKFVFLNFPQNVSSADATINVPFMVKYIHVKQSALTCITTVPAVGAAQYIGIESDLVQNQPMGIVYNDSTYPTAINDDIEYILPEARAISGSFTFNLKNSSGSAYANTIAGGINILLLLEFNSEGEM